MKPTDLQSKVIAFMRFPLVVLLLFMHCNFTALGGEWASLPFASRFIDIFSQRVAPIVIPVTFFISGYLFFKTGQFTLDIYIKKLIRRLQSLFVPYLLWNLLYLLLAIILGLFIGKVPILGIPFDDLTFTGAPDKAEHTHVKEQLHFWAKGDRTTTWAFGNYSSSNIMYFERFVVTAASGSVWLKRAEHHDPTPTPIPTPRG